MFKTNLDFANLCLYSELDEISCCFIFCDVWVFFCVSISHQKYNSPKFFFCCSIYSLQHYAHHRKTHCCAFCQLRKLFSVGFTWKRTIDCVLLRLYTLLPKTALPTAQSSFTKSNDGTVTVHHVPFAREKSLNSLISV